MRLEASPPHGPLIITGSTADPSARRPHAQVLADTADNDTMVQSELHEKCQTTQGHSRMTNALLYGIICDRTRGPAFLRYLTLVVKDQFAYCCKQLHRLALEKFPKMNDRGAIQNSPQQASLLWLVKELVGPPHMFCGR